MHPTHYTEAAMVVSVSLFQLLHCVVIRHDAPRVIISYCGRQVVTNVIEYLLRLCSSHFCHSTQYHPLINIISMCADSCYKNWDESLPLTTCMYNTAQKETAGSSPFFLHCARTPSIASRTYFALLYILHTYILCK